MYIIRVETDNPIVEKIDFEKHIKVVSIKPDIIIMNDSSFIIKSSFPPPKFIYEISEDYKDTMFKVVIENTEFNTLNYVVLNEKK